MSRAPEADTTFPTAPVVTVAVIAAGWFLLRGITPTNASYYLSRRLPQVASVVIAGGGIGVAAVVFQTVTRNRLLTPSVMGIEALYVLLQTAMVYLLGSSSVAVTRPVITYIVTVAAMVLFAASILRGLMAAGRPVDHVLLTGVVMGMLFRSGSGFLQMVIDPNEFSVVQNNIFASVNNVPTAVVPAAVPIFLFGTWYVWRRRRRLDVIALGREQALSLGVEFERETRALLMAASALVASSTALVGPLPFLGLLSSNLVRQVNRSWRHSALVPQSAAAAVTVLLGLELLRRLTGTGIPLGTVLTLLGGVFFLILVFRRDHP
tara:strand:- start:526 stop:1488 length:963 start_codon:yes stop_codon:yes gene_type:complete